MPPTNLFGLGYGVGPAGYGYPSVGRWSPLSLSHILVIGQSNANGNTGAGPALSTSPLGASGGGKRPAMFNGGLRPGAVAASMVSVVPLAESETGAQTGGETVCSSLGYTLSGLTSKQLFFSIAARDSSGYTSLKKGTTPYADAIAQVTAAYNYCVARGIPYEFLGLVLIHGETDTQLGTLNYATKLAEWQSDFKTDINAVTGRTDNVRLFVSQQSVYAAATYGTADTAVASYAAWKADNANVVLACPRYFAWGQQADGNIIHQKNYSQRWLGAIIARAIYNREIVGNSWKPLTPIAGQLTRSGAVITAQFNVPVGSIQLKYDYVGRVHPTCGFEFYDDSGTPPTVASVEVASADTLTITLSDTPTGAGQVLRYGYTGAGGPFNGSVRGNVCDSETETSIDGLPCRNWLVSFEEAVT